MQNPHPTSWMSGSDVFRLCFRGLEQPPPIFASPPHLPAGLPSALLLPYWWPQLGLRPRCSLKPFSSVSLVQGLPKLGQAHHQPPSSALRVECFNQEPPWVLLGHSLPLVHLQPPFSGRLCRRGENGSRPTVHRLLERCPSCAGGPMTLASLLCLRPPALGPGARASPDSVTGRTKADFHPSQVGAQQRRRHPSCRCPSPVGPRAAAAGRGAETREPCPSPRAVRGYFKAGSSQGHPPPRPRATSTSSSLGSALNRCLFA